MAKQIEGVYERIMECAKKEFLEKGFKDASLRVIASNAQTSTGSIYTRFHSKEGLFGEIVEPVVDGMMEKYLRIQETFSLMEPEYQKKSMGDYTAGTMEELIDYMYDHFDEFCLLLDASYGTEFQSFQEELVRIEVEYTNKYMEHVGCKNLLAEEISGDFFYSIVVIYFNSIFEVIRQRLSREKAKQYIKLLNRYHMAGNNALYNFFEEK